MNELIDKMVEKAGITPEQAQQSLSVIKDFVKEKFPMLGGAVDNIFPGEVSASDPLDAPNESNAAAPKAEEGWLDKISDIIPGEMGEKIESMAKNAAEGAGDAAEKAKGFASDMYNKAKSGAEDLIAKAKDKLD